MNISQAKEYIKHDIKLYLKKDQQGEYRIPVVRQRPIFLLGAPGIGKTAIMEQIAGELGIALVSYSMTHHTRQSALGLPFIRHEQYGEMEYDVSEYTMSEIIASIYDIMKNSQVTEGILFLDEINCVSETLAPAMLQFLQYKVFGKHQVPEGWVIVTAGNPPEYNKSVREFDVVTMDRLKILDVEADYETWKRYAREKGLNPVVLSFLEIKRDYFYHMEMTTKGRSYVTARGWEDLATIISLYEEEQLEVNENLVEQYIRNPKIVQEFVAYYVLYNKYKRDYQLEAILAGTASEAAIRRGQEAGFDERLSVLGMLIDGLQVEIRQVMAKANGLNQLMPGLKRLKCDVEQLSGAEVIQRLGAFATARREIIRQKQQANSLSVKEKSLQRELVEFYEQAAARLQEQGDLSGAEAFAIVKAAFDEKVAGLKEETSLVKLHLHHVFGYVEEAFSKGNEMLLFVTELTVNQDSASFISQFGCQDYEKASQELMLSQRRNVLMEEIKALEL